MAAAEPIVARGRSLRLSSWLLLALFVFAAALAVVLIGYVGPRTEGAFTAHGNDLIAEGSQAMHEVAAEQTATTSRVLIDLIEQGTRTRRQRLEDLPLELCAGDVAAIRATIQADDARRSQDQRLNVTVLAHEMQVRTERRIKDRFAELSALQARLVDRAGDELRRTHLIMIGLALGLLLAVLGLGLDRLVVRPTRALRAATRRIADGQLDTDLPHPSGTELGDLARDFGAMVAELRDSRRQLQSLNSNLEQEVAKKTEHLERALTDLRSSHRQLAQTERLAALGTLAGGIAHEFHNVIGGIRGCTDELLADENDGDRRETMQVILRAADRATGIVQQLLRFARRSVEQHGKVDPNAIVEEALRLCEPAARRQGVVVERALATGVSLHGDADALHQVVVNLLLNALQAMPDGGRLRIEVAARQQGIAITVADTGTGIAADDLEHVFEPFFTRRDDPKARGTGLGLSVSYGLVTAHGGSIQVESESGHGATFTV
ncbi:MAG: HAMP domain-containing protein, partial [Planctomycetes bacterium]|nr:HAMP domain-containing protein [Planctomycetota bacterium]